MIAVNRLPSQSRTAAIPKPAIQRGGNMNFIQIVQADDRARSCMTSPCLNRVPTTLQARGEWRVTLRQSDFRHPVRAHRANVQSPGIVVPSAPGRMKCGSTAMLAFTFRLAAPANVTGIVVGIFVFQVISGFRRGPGRARL